MQSEHSQAIVSRFYEAIARLKQERRIRGVQTFTRRYGINRWNFITCGKNPRSDIFQVAWLEYLVRDYGVSPYWLLLGEGDFWKDGKTGITAPDVIPQEKNKNTNIC